MQRNVATIAKRQLPDLTTNYLLSSLISGNAATPSPRGRGPRRIGVHGSNRGVEEDKTEKSWHDVYALSDHTACAWTQRCSRKRMVSLVQGKT